jgi:hypothetical protein
MTTAGENERLATLEVKVGSIERDVAEIKADVKSLINNQTAIAIDLAAERAAEAAVRQSRGQVAGVLKFLSERAIAIIALAVSAWVAYNS